MFRKWIMLLIVFVLVLSAAGCKRDQTTTGADAQLANPASVYCGEQGGKVEMRTDETGGQIGYCVFPDGSECEEWAFFRGECGVK
jgi:putative hemolysin